MARYGGSRRSSAPRAGRWMDLRYAGKCSVCGKGLAAGVWAFYEPSDRTVTCVELECAKQRGLTEEVWHGSPVSGRYVEVLTATRRDFADQGTDPFVKTRSRGYYGHDAGRCEDAPCCGCCS